MTNKKRFIVFILVFIFSFNMIFYSPSDDTFRTEPVIAHAEPITLTTGLLLAILAFLACCGIVITTPDMAEDLAQRVYDGIKDIPGAITQHKNRVKFNLVAGVLDTIKTIVANLPEDTVTVPTAPVTRPLSSKIDVDTPSLGDSYTFTVTNSSSSLYITFHYTYTNSTNGSTFSTSQSMNISDKPVGTYVAKFVRKYFETSKIYGVGFQLYCPDGTVITPSMFSSESNYSSMRDCYFKLSDASCFNPEFDYSGSVDIPYSPDTTKDVDYETKPKEWFPSLDNPAFGGSISVPINQPLPDISVDAPIIFGDDFVADNDISIDSVDTSLPDNSVDSDSVLDKILDAVLGFFTGFWDTFSSLLDGLLAPIVGLLNWIYELLKPIIGFFGDILKFLGDILSAIIDGVIGAISSLSDLLTGILDFLLSLVDALIDALVGALEGLFVPTIDISKAFEIPENVFVPFHEFEFDDLFSITPKPVRFSTTLTFGTIVYPIKIYFDEISVISDNIGLIRNIFSYALLLASIYSAIAVFLPKRVMD